MVKSAEDYTMKNWKESLKASREARKNLIKKPPQRN